MNAADADLRGHAGSRAESEFLAAMSHELRTPIHGMIGLAELLAKARLPAAEGDYVKMIAGCARTLLTLVDNVLDIAQIEAGHLRLEDAELDLRQLLRELARDFGQRCEEKGLVFETGTEPGAPAWIVGDAGRLRLILCNLLDNAVKFTAAGGVSLDLHVRRLPVGQRLAFVVRDTGVGIAPAAQAHLFKRFARRDGCPRKHPGAGLGLAVARELARRMGGDIEVASRTGEGSTFTLVLPWRAAAGDRTARALPPPAGAAILLVDDNPVNQVVAHGLLEHLGYTRVTLAADGVQALDACARERFDLVLMDCQMPEMDGLRATALLRERGVATPILALTASPMVGDRDRCLAAGMDDYLTKPVEPALLALKLAQWLDAPPRSAAIVAPATVAPAAAPAFDARALQDRFFEDADLFRECRHIFLRQTPQRLEELADSIATDDLPRARFLAHSLRGSAATLGAQQLAECCRSIEKGLASGEDALSLAGPQMGVARSALAAFTQESQAYA